MVIIFGAERRSSTDEDDSSSERTALFYRDADAAVSRETKERIEQINRSDLSVVFARESHSLHTEYEDDFIQRISSINRIFIRSI
jgi:hypothetical protein